MVSTKKCVDCHALKPVDAFRKSQHVSGGFSSRCLQCYATRRKGSKDAAAERKRKQDRERARKKNAKLTRLKLCHVCYQPSQGAWYCTACTAKRTAKYPKRGRSTAPKSSSPPSEPQLSASVATPVPTSAPAPTLQAFWEKQIVALLTALDDEEENTP